MCPQSYSLTRASCMRRGLLEVRFSYKNISSYPPFTQCSEVVGQEQENRNISWNLSNLMALFTISHPSTIHTFPLQNLDAMLATPALPSPFGIFFLLAANFSTSLAFQKCGATSFSQLASMGATPLIQSPLVMTNS